MLFGCYRCRSPACFFCLSVFLSYRIVFRYMWLSFFFSPFGSFALASVLRTLSFAIRLPMSSSLRFFLPLEVFVSDSFHLRDHNLLLLLVCVFVFFFLHSLLSVVKFLFPFRFCFVDLANAVSTSSFCMIMISCVTLWNDSFSFPFFPVLWTFLFSSWSFGVVLFFLYCGYLLGFPEVVC